LFNFAFFSLSLEGIEKARVDMKTTNVILSDKFERIVSTRVAVENLFKDIHSCNVIIDFLDIQFISSSAAHQMVLEIKRLEKEKSAVTCVNMNKDVYKMVELAKTDRKNLFTLEPLLKHNVINSEKDLKHFNLEII
jgi:anti-anti-sigma regulatory factor